MKFSMYVLRDVLSDISDGIFMYRNDEHALAELAHRLNPSQRERMQLLCVGEYDNELHNVVNTQVKLVGFVPSPNTESPKGVQTPLDSGSIADQEQRFLEKTASIGV